MALLLQREVYAGTFAEDSRARAQEGGEPKRALLLQTSENALVNVRRIDLSGTLIAHVVA